MKNTIVLAVLLVSHPAVRAHEAPPALSQLAAVDSSGAERSGEVLDNSLPQAGHQEQAPVIPTIEPLGIVIPAETLSQPRVDVSGSALKKAVAAVPAGKGEPAAPAAKPTAKHNAGNAAAFGAIGGGVGWMASGYESGKSLAIGAGIGALVGYLLSRKGLLPGAVEGQ